VDACFVKGLFTDAELAGAQPVVQPALPLVGRAGAPVAVGSRGRGRGSRGGSRGGSSPSADGASAAAHLQPQPPVACIPTGVAEAEA